MTISASLAGANAAPSFASDSKQAVFISPMESTRSTWNLEEYVSLLEGAGYEVDLVFDENASVTFFATALSNYDVVILRTDSFTREGFNFYCTGEPVTWGTRTTYAEEISARALDAGVCLGFSMKFIDINYVPGSLRNGMVYVIDGYSADLAGAFLNAGSAVYVGYYDAYPLGWGRIDALSLKFLSYVTAGHSVKEAVPMLYTYLCLGHGVTGNWPSIFYYGEGSFRM